MENTPNLRLCIPFLTVTDMTASLKFYLEGLGFTLINQWTPRGKIEWCWIERDGVALMMQQPVKNDHPIFSTEKKGFGITLILQCRDTLLLYREFLDRGLQPSQPFVGNNLWVSSLNDPDGYRVEFASPTDVPEETSYSEWMARQ